MASDTSSPDVSEMESARIIACGERPARRGVRWEAVEYANGDKYTGYVAARTGARHGDGTYVFCGSTGVFEGVYDGDERRAGTVRCGGGKYTGAFEDGERHGIGSCVYGGGEEYHGSWVRGKRHGHGTYVMRDGTRFVGRWFNGHPEDGTFGVYVLPDGRAVNGIVNGDGEIVKDVTVTDSENRAYVPVGDAGGGGGLAYIGTLATGPLWRDGGDESGTTSLERLEEEASVTVISKSGTMSGSAHGARRASRGSAAGSLASIQGVIADQVTVDVRGDDEETLFDEERRLAEQFE